MEDALTDGRGLVSTVARAAESSESNSLGIHSAVRPAPAHRPPTWTLRNWPVRWKVVAMVTVPLVLAMVFGGLRIYGAVTDARDLRLAADRAEVVPAITKYMAALDSALLATSGGGDVGGAQKNYDARKDELQSRLTSTDVAPDVRVGVGMVLNGGQALLDAVASNSIGLREQVTTFAPVLLTAENVVDASVRVDSAQIRAAAQGLSRAIGARGQMMMQQLLITGGAELPEAELRTSMITLAGTEPSTLFGMAEVLGVGSPAAKKLQQQLVTRLAIMSDPASQLVDNPELLRSVQTTDAIAAEVIKDTTASVTTSLHDRATSRHDAAVRDAVLVLAAIAAALGIVVWVARSLIQPLRVLKYGALKVAHTDLDRGIARARAGDDQAPEPLPIHTTEEIGQVAHALDELHTQALLLAGDEARLRWLVNDMFETMSRRNRSLVDQQLALIDRLERDEADPDRLDSLFRLDHLATRMRRNSANLMVLAGAQASRADQRGPVPLPTVINAAISEVEDYRRVETAAVSDCTITTAAAGDVVHLLAELIDNALRYSPPTSPVRVSAAARADGGLLLQVVDAGLGMTDGDRRMANIRLRAGGEVTPDVSPDSARHMGLFVVGRLADRHGIRVRLCGPGERRSGTTAEVYLPPTALVGADPQGSSAPGAAASSPAPPRLGEPAAPPDDGESPDRTRPAGTAGRDGPTPGKPPLTVLPQRSPGSSGITGIPVGPTGHPDMPARELPQAWWETRHPVEASAEQPAAQAVTDTSAFFAARSPKPATSPPPRRPAQTADDDWPAAAAAAPRSAPESDLIYQRMLSEWLVDPRELAHSADLDWKSVWDHGWSAAAEAENVPVRARTDHGLPVREPGARLVPGAVTPDTDGVAQHRAERGGGAAPNGGTDSRPEPGRHPTHAAPAPDPEAIRTSISSHFGGVRAGRSHARDTRRGPDGE